MGAWSVVSRVQGYAMVSGYGTHSGWITEFDLWLDKNETIIAIFEAGDTAAHGPIVGSVNVQFGDFEVGPPGGTVGQARSLSGGGSAIDVQLPRAEAHIFWRAIRDIDMQKHVLVISMDENNAVTGFSVQIDEGSTVGTDKDRRERMDSVRQRLGVTPGTTLGLS